MVDNMYRGEIGRTVTMIARDGQVTARSETTLYRYMQLREDLHRSSGEGWKEN